MGQSVEAVPATSNEEIGFAIRRRLNENPTATAGVIVEVDDGRVTLRGTAPDLAAAWRAEAVARSVKGVKQVVNQIIVGGAGR
jgi:osmotically-inducible protein OsmY